MFNAPESRVAEIERRVSILEKTMADLKDLARRLLQQGVQLGSR